MTTELLLNGKDPYSQHLNMDPALMARFNIIQQGAIRDDRHVYTIWDYDTHLVDKFDIPTQLSDNNIADLLNTDDDEMPPLVSYIVRVDAKGVEKYVQQ